jgi:hypothetical protein
MRTFIILTSFALISITGFGQNKDIDNIFNKFDGKNGVTSVNITKDMMNLVAQMDSSDFKAKDLLAQISRVRILAFENAVPEDKVSFETMVKSLPLKDYKELMVVKEKEMNVKMLSLESQGRIAEFLLLVTGGNHQALVSITGNIDPKQLGKLPEFMKMHGCEQLAKLGKK